MNIETDIDNLFLLMRGEELPIDKKADAILEFANLVEYAMELESKIEYLTKATGIYTTENEDSAEILIGDILIVMDGKNQHSTHTVELKNETPMIENEELESFIEECLNEGLNVLKKID